MCGVVSLRDVTPEPRPSGYVTNLRCGTITNPHTHGQPLTPKQTHARTNTETEHKLTERQNTNTHTHMHTHTHTHTHIHTHTPGMPQGRPKTVQKRSRGASSLFH